jgi:hypothetical protein
MLCPRATHTTRRRLPQRRSCSKVQNKPAHETYLNKGFTNPKYKRTPQDLTNKNGGENSGMQA